MTPFDVTYAQEFLIQQEFASAPQHQVAVFPAFRPVDAGQDLSDAESAAMPLPALPSARAYSLLDATAKSQAVADHPSPRSLQTPSYMEFLLQMLDRDSVLTSLLVIGAYIGLIQSL